MTVAVHSVPPRDLTNAELERWRDIPVAVAVDVGRAKGQIDPAIRPLLQAGRQPRLFGRAVTALCEPPDFGAVLLAIDRIGAGEVLVIAAQGRAETAMIGELWATSLSAMTMALWRSTPTPSEAASAMRKPSCASRGNGRRASPPAGRWLKPLDLQSRQHSESQPARSLKRSRFPTALANDKQQRMIQEQTSAVLSALRTIATERKGLDALEEAIRATSEGGLGAAFSEAIKTISAAPGRVIVTGIGKSGHIARKIAATLASTGEPAFFVHPAEASHGDLGMVQIGDVVLAISWSGETAALAAIVTFAKRYAIPLIAMTAEANSTLGREAGVCLTMPGAPGPAPTGSRPQPLTTMRLVLGDALAIALPRAGFTAPAPRSSSGGKLAQARACGKRTHRRPRAAHSRQRPDGRGDRRDDVEGFRLRRGFRRGGAPRRYHHGRRFAPSPEAGFLPRYAGRRDHDPAPPHDRARCAGRGGARADQPQNPSAPRRRAWPSGWNRELSRSYAHRSVLKGNAPAGNSVCAP